MSATALKSRLGNKVQGLQTVSAVPKVPTAKSVVGASGAFAPKVTQSDNAILNFAAPTISEPSVVASDYVALTTNAIAIINENLKHQPLSHQLFDIIKAPSGGITAFSVPGISGDEIEKELSGIILDYAMVRAYWEGSGEPIEGTPPSCFSRDSIVSVDGKPCITCVYNTYGSKIGTDSNAKACKEAVELYLLRPNSILPVIVRVPVSSKPVFQKYLARLISKMMAICGVTTKITLEKATSNGGQPYAKFLFEAVKVLSQEETDYARAFGQKFSEMLSLAYEVCEAHGVETGEGV
jgi:hypothetical protein